jgi:hypothetical protein
MNSSLADQLDEAISALLAGGKTAPHWVREIHQLLPIADDLWYLPRPEFRASLRDQLLQRAGNHDVFGALAQAAQRKAATRPESVVPPLFITESGAFPVRGSHLALSFALHVAALALVVASGWWMVENHAVVRNTMAQLIATDNYSSPPAPTTASGGEGVGTTTRCQPRAAVRRASPPHS